MPTGKPKPRKRRKIRLTDKEQSARFISAAKALGLGQSGADFERAMDALAPKKPKCRSS
jgi:hypothetical protein